MNHDIIKIDRHRMGTDGGGCSTLVVFHGCPLSCRYCINDFCHNSSIKIENHKVEELLNIIRIDDIYFRMTGGGVVFGGGEPILHSEYIREFIWISPKEWQYRIETSLNTSWDNVERLIPYIDLWIIDIKDMDPLIYKTYTGLDNQTVIENIQKLTERVAPEKIRFRIPLIPGYNTKEDQERSACALRGLGVIEKFHYKIKE